MKERGKCRVVMQKIRTEFSPKLIHSIKTQVQEILHPKQGKYKSQPIVMAQWNWKTKSKRKFKVRENGNIDFKKENKNKYKGQITIIKMKKRA